MKTRTINKRGYSATARLPESSDVDAMVVGGMAPSAFGRMALVTRIFHYEPGKRVCYVAATGTGDTVENGCGCSNTMTRGVLMRDVILTGALTSAECDDLEAEMRREA